MMIFVEGFESHENIWGKTPLLSPLIFPKHKVIQFGAITFVTLQYNKLN